MYLGAGKECSVIRMLFLLCGLCLSTVVSLLVRLPPLFPVIEHFLAPSKIILQVQHGDVHPMTLLTHLMNINLYHKEGTM